LAAPGDLNRESAEAAADAIRAELSLGAAVSRFDTGSVPVFAAGDRFVIKLFPADEESHFAAERAALTLVDARLGIPTPQVAAAGSRDDWHFIVMTRLQGRLLAGVWSILSPDERRELARTVGIALRELHSITAEDWGPLAVDWPRYMQTQREGCVKQQASRGLPAPWIHQVDEFVSRWFPRDDGRRVLLHTEVMREHLLVERTSGGWRLTGLFDFEPSMVGAPDYELASVGIFVAGAEAGVLRAVLEGYGMGPDDDLAPRIMAYALLHRYSNLRWYLERLPPVPDAKTIEALARGWFAS